MKQSKSRARAHQAESHPSTKPFKSDWSFLIIRQMCSLNDKPLREFHQQRAELSFKQRTLYFNYPRAGVLIRATAVNGSATEIQLNYGRL